VATMVTYLRWIPLLPFLGMLFHVTVGARAGRGAVNAVACGALLGAFALAIRAFTDLPASGGAVVDPVYRWIEAGGLVVDATLVVDRLSAIMCLVVTGVGFLIHVYSTGYMAHEPDHARYFAYLNLFTASMLVLVLADSLPLMFVGWEGVGLCSYLLIGFWYTDRAKADAGKKAFVANRVGDAAFAVDPLSGQGIFEAVATGLAAVPVVNTLLRRPQDRSLAEEFYRRRVEETFLRLARAGRDSYRAERRWGDSPFWGERRAWPDDEPGRAAAGPASIQTVAVSEDGYVVSRRAVVTPDHPRGVWRLEDVEIVPLLEFAEARRGEAEQDVAAAYAARFGAPRPSVDRALSWLRHRGLI